MFQLMNPKRPSTRQATLFGSSLGSPWTAAGELGIVILSTLAAGAWQTPEEDSRTSRWLQSHGLLELQQGLLLRKLAAQEPQQREQAARRMALVYIDQLTALSEDAVANGAARRKLDDLLEQFPEIADAPLRMRLARAIDLELQRRLRQWREGRNRSARLEAAKSARVIAADMLSQLQPALQTPTDRLTADWTAYLSGWACYSLAVIPDAEGADARRAAAWFVEGSTHFQRLLRLSPRNQDDAAWLGALRQVQPQWLGLANPGRARGLVGLMLCQYGLGRDEAGDLCRVWIRGAETAPEVRDQMPARLVQHWLDAANWRRAADAAERDLPTLRPPVTAGKLAWCDALVRAAWTDPGLADDASEPMTPALRDRFLAIGGRGFCRLGAYAALAATYETLRVASRVSPAPPPDAARLSVSPAAVFLSCWLEGRHLGAAADRSGDPKLYARAAAWLEVASKMEFEDPATEARCRLDLAWCQYRLARWPEALTHYEAIADPLIDHNQQDAAAQALWMAFACRQNIDPVGAESRLKARQALMRLAQTFPAHPLARRAGYYLERLQEGGVLTTASLARLQAIAPDDVNYMASRYDLCLILRRLLEEESADEARRRRCWSNSPSRRSNTGSPQTTNRRRRRFAPRCFSWTQSSIKQTPIIRGRRSSPDNGSLAPKSVWPRWTRRLPNRFTASRCVRRWLGKMTPPSLSTPKYCRNRPIRPGDATRW